MKVYNRSKQEMERAKYVKCPRCKGFGAVLGDDESCSICKGNGKAWVSESGWTRPKDTKYEDSELY